MTEVEQMRKDVNDLKKYVELADATERLLDNRDFKEVFLEHFMTQECARNAQMSSDPNLREDVRKACLDLAQAAGHVQRFLKVTIAMGDKAKGDIKDINEEIALTHEELE